MNIFLQKKIHKNAKHIFRYSYLYFLLCICIANADAQIYEGTLILSSQELISRFNYTEVHGELIIREEIPGNIQNIDALSSLVKVVGTLQISNNTNLSNINGMRSLVSVDEVDDRINGSLIINGNDRLENLDGLSSLVSVTGSVQIVNNNALQNIDGLRKFTLIGASSFKNLGDLNIENNKSLRDLNGFSKLNTIWGLAHIKNNISLDNINGLSNLQLCISVYIEDNPNLYDFCGLNPYLNSPYSGTVYTSGNGFNPTAEQIRNSGPCKIFNGNLELTTQEEIDSFNYTEIYGSLTIQEHIPGTIKNLNGLSELESINDNTLGAGSLSILHNTALTDLHGLEKLEHVGNLQIEGNTSLLYVNALSGIKSIELTIQTDECIPIKTPGSLVIKDNPSLISLLGLSGFKELGLLQIENNDALVNIDYLEGIKIFYKYCINEGRDILNMGSVIISENESLLNINALKNVDLLQYLNIINNKSLNDISGLSNIYAVGILYVEYDGAINIIGNPSLTEFCGLYKLFSGNFYMVKSISITGNGANPSPEEIAENGPCPAIFNGDMVLSSQNEIDLFNYYEVNGNLSIIESIPGNIKNLDGLSELIAVKQDLNISHNISLENLDGLMNLKTVGSGLEDLYGSGTLTLSYNESITDLDGLRNLSHIVSSLVIQHNSSLQNINALSGMGMGWDWHAGYIPGSISITDNLSLESLDGLSISDLNNLIISNNISLKNINALKNLLAVGWFPKWGPFQPGWLVINGNKSLTEFCSLYNLFVSPTSPAVDISGNGLNPTIQQIISNGPCEVIISLNAMTGTLSGDAHLGTMTGSINPRAVYFQGFNGGVLFNINIPQSSGNWYAWARMYYMSSGEKNSFNLTFNNMKFVFGDNDNKYNQWHWDGNNGARINLGVLTPGQHKLFISGREPGLTLWIDQIIITNNPDYIPPGFTPTTSIITLNTSSGTTTGDAMIVIVAGGPVDISAVCFKGFNGGVALNVNLPPSKRNWSAWARMYYRSDGGKNSFYFIMGGNKYILGDNDNQYDHWHWDGNNGTRINLGVLSPGEHTIMISGREPGLSLWVEQIILTDDPEFIPDGFSFTTSSIYLNAMNGTFTGDARLGTMTGSLNPRCVYFQGTNGGVSFNVTVPSSQKDWYLWGRVYYNSSGMKNSFYISADGVKYVLGDNDIKYNQWHWDGSNGSKINIGTLAAGNHTIKISGREPGLTLWVDKIILTDDPNFIPSDVLIKGMVEQDSVESEQQVSIPSEFSLYQNYPNPFNPVTTIKYSIPQKSNVKIMIFDILGKEVSNLVNEEKLPGNYEIRYDANNLSSGVYFYRIQAGDFIDTKKFLLLK